MIRRIAGHILLVLLMLLCLPAVASAQTQKEKQRLAEYNRQINDLRSRISDVQKSGADAEARLRLINAEIGLREELVREAAFVLDSLSGEMTLRGERLDSLHLRLDTLKVSFTTLIRTAYKSRGAKHWYLYVFSGDSFSQSVRRAQYMQALGRSVEEEAGRIREVKAEVEAEMVRLDSLRAVSQTLTEQRKADVKALQRTRREAEQLLSTLRKDKKSYEAKLKRTIAERDALDKAIREAIAAASSSSSSRSGSSSSSRSSSGRSGSTSVDATLGGKFSANKGKLPWPAEGIIVERFGANVDPVFHTTVQCDGITLSVKPGAEIHAIYDGEVTSVVKSKSKFNYIVIIQHGTYRTIYCYLDDVPSVQPGTKVKTGQTIGRALVIDGASQFHFQIRDANTSPLDPKVWLRK